MSESLCSITILWTAVLLIWYHTTQLRIIYVKWSQTLFKDVDHATDLNIMWELFQQKHIVETAVMQY